MPRALAQESVVVIAEADEQKVELVEEMAHPKITQSQ